MMDVVNFTVFSTCFKSPIDPKKFLKVQLTLNDASQVSVWQIFLREVNCPNWLLTFVMVKCPASLIPTVSVYVEKWTNLD